MHIAVLIVAGGRGLRAAAGGATIPKQYVRLGGKTVIQRTLDAFVVHPAVTRIVPVIHADDRSLFDSATTASDKVLHYVIGGRTRQQSVLAGLQSLADDPPDFVLIHDAARPLVESAVIDRVIEGLQISAAVIPGLAVSDTLKRWGPANQGISTVPRDNLWAVQTPQGFKFAGILSSHLAAAGQNLTDFTDDAAIAEWAGLKVVIVEGGRNNVKLTTLEDFAIAEAMLTTLRYETRIGSGFDVHRFAEGSSVWLGGVEIAHTHRLDGHSDADVVLHALTDALLGAIGDGDIGQHFPPSEPKWKGAASRIFLEDAARRLKNLGGRVVNADVTVLAEAPKVGPHRPAMQSLIAALLDVTPNRIGIKATTMEELGSIGRREGIAAMATVSVELLRRD